MLSFGAAQLRRDRWLQLRRSLRPISQPTRRSCSLTRDSDVTVMAKKTKQQTKNTRLIYLPRNSRPYFANCGRSMDWPFLSAFNRGSHQPALRCCRTLLSRLRRMLAACSSCMAASATSRSDAGTNLQQKADLAALSDGRASEWTSDDSRTFASATHTHSTSLRPQSGSPADQLDQVRWHPRS